MPVDAPRPRRWRTLVAVLPLALAACTGGDGGATAEDLPDTDADIAVLGTDDLEWEPATLQAEPGEISLSLTCQEGVNHNFVVDEVGPVAECSRGQTVETTFELGAGTYEYRCTVPGHERTMRGELTVG